METIGKLIGLIFLGAIGTIPLRVVVGMVSPKSSETATFVVSAAASFILMGALLFWNPEAATRDPEVAIREVQRSKAALLADLEREKSECRQLSISLSAEAQEFRDKLVNRCFDGVRESAAITIEQIRTLDRRIEELRPVSR